MRLDHLTDAVVRAVLPFQSELRRLKRHLRPYEEDPGNSAYCITNGLEQLAALRESGIAVADAEVLEFGTGWTPPIPLLFHMAGARRLILTDIAKLMNEYTIAQARDVVARRIGDISLALGRPA